MLGLTRPTGVLGVVESKVWGLAPMTLRKLRGQRTIPYLRKPPVVREQSA